MLEINSCAIDDKKLSAKQRLIKDYDARFNNGEYIYLFSHKHLSYGVYFKSDGKYYCCFTDKYINKICITQTFAMPDGVINFILTGFDDEIEIPESKSIFKNINKTVLEKI